MKINIKEAAQIVAEKVIQDLRDSGVFIGRWIPVKWHEITEEEREKEGYPNEWLVHLDCILPEDGEEILFTTKYGIVEKDTAYCDDGYYLDSGYDWVDDVVAWMPLPKPYKAEMEE